MFFVVVVSGFVFLQFLFVFFSFISLLGFFESLE